MNLDQRSRFTHDLEMSHFNLYTDVQILSNFIQFTVKKI